MNQESFDPRDTLLKGREKRHSFQSLRESICGKSDKADILNLSHCGSARSFTLYGSTAEGGNCIVFVHLSIKMNPQNTIP